VISPELREFAQVPDRFTWTSPDVERRLTDRYGVIQGNVWAGVFGIRVADGEVEDLVAEVRRSIPPGKDAAWWIDPDARPHDLHEQLVALGLQVPETGHTLHALACTEEPPPARAGIDVARVAAFEEFEAATEIMWDAFDTEPEQREKQRLTLRADFEGQLASQVPVTFLARVDGRPAGVGRSIYSDRGVFLIAGSVAPWARGRGVYRALVRARWEDAAARGTPALVTEAMPDTSYPILKRIGFEDVCTIRRLKDRR
jgi:ribosomal protein S18 acetylase RimI-like enzyme